MGERNFGFRLKEGVYTLWAKDALKEIEDGLGGHNTYGLKKFYIIYL